MNNDQVAGKIDQVTGKVKQHVGEAVGNQDLANRGLAEQVKGAAKETWGNAKDAADKIHEDHANRTRENISEHTEQLKNRANQKIEAVKEEHREKETHRTA